jgi:hypothetical protein
MKLKGAKLNRSAVVKALKSLFGSVGLAGL